MPRMKARGTRVRLPPPPPLQPCIYKGIDESCRFKTATFFILAKHRFKITSFTNKTGSKAFRVSGTLDGKTVRKNFKTRDAAVAFRQELDIEYLKDESEGQTVWTTLTHDQNREAIAAVNLLKRSGYSPHLSVAAESIERLLSGSMPINSPPLTFS